MNKRFQKIAALSCATALTLSLLTPSALANGNGKDNGKDKGSTGAGQTAVHIHGVKDIAGNKDEVTITVGDKSYTGVLKGDKLTIEMGSTDNGFDFGKDESLEIGYKTANGSGTILIKHQEGNGANIGTEHDKGLNNFKGEVKPNPVPSTQPSAEPSTQPSAEPSTEPSAQPSAQPSAEPSTEPSAQPSAQPSAEPSAQPSAEPSTEPSAQPSAEPSTQPSTEPSAEPSTEPSTEPSAEPSTEPSAEPSTEPSTEPSAEPSTEPSAEPSAEVEILEDPTPLAPVPEVVLEESPVPLTDLPEETIEIEEETVPLGDLPQTGTAMTPADPTVTAGLSAIAASLAAIGLLIKRTGKKNDDAE